MPLSDLLHDEVDDLEALSGEARDIVRRRLAELPEILATIAMAEDTGEIAIGQSASQSIADAMDIVAMRVAGDMNALTTTAARHGVEAGRKRVRG